MRFQGDDVPAAERRDYWQYVVDSALGPLELRHSGLGAGDVLVADTAGPVTVGQLQTSAPGEARRTTAQLRRLDADLCKIDILVRGSARVEQNGRTAELRPGDFTLIDLSRPARWSNSSMCMVAVVFPRAALAIGSDQIGTLTGVPIAGRPGLENMITSTARQLLDCIGSVDLYGRARLGSALLDLLAVTLQSRLGATNQVLPSTTRDFALVRSVQTFIAANLHDPGLSPQTVATAHRISIRYLYRLFEDQGATPAAWIRQLRLERCRQDLLDAAHHNRAVSAIAARWGLLNPTHFSRAFRKAFGIGPAEYRMVGTDNPRPSSQGRR